MLFRSGGELQLESTPGQGSRFWFTIELPEADPTQNNRPRHNTLRGMQGMTALVVDDNACTRTAISEMARSMGWQVDTAATSDEGVRDVERQISLGQPYDVIFVDGRMPDRDGWQTAERIRNLQAERRSPLIIMVTAYGREMLARRQLEDPKLLDGVLIKPVTPGMLLDAVTLPDKPASELAYQPPARHDTRLTGVHVLLVEDNPTNQQVARELLALEGATVALADSGKAALEVLNRQQEQGGPMFDLVLMDIQMPDMDGHEATHHIREDMGLTQLPIIAMTANAMPSDREAALQAGMNDHIGKPFDLDQLVGVIRQHVAMNDAAVDPTTILDTQGALKRLGGFQSIYARTLRHYGEDIQSALAQWSDLPNASDLSRRLHTLKGMAATVGAQQVARLAAELEEAAQTAPGHPAALAPRLDALRVALAISMEAALRHASAIEERTNENAYTG